MDIPLPGEPEPVSLIPTPDSPDASKNALHRSNDFSICSSQSSRTESFYSDIPMPDEKPEQQDRLSRYSPSGPFMEDEPSQGSSPSANVTNRFLVLGKVQAKKRLLAFSATKQAGGAGLTFNLPKKITVKPRSAKGFEQLTEDGDLTPDVLPLVKKKAGAKKGAPKEDKAKAVVSAIEEIKREELLMRGAFRMAAQSSSSAEASGINASLRHQDRKKEGDVFSLVDDLLDKDKDKEKDKEKKSRSRKHRSSSDKKSERHTRDKEKNRDRAKEKDQKSKEKTKIKIDICKLPVSWAEFRTRKMDFDQIRRAKRELLKKKSSKHSSRSKDALNVKEQFEKELCNPLDFPSRRKEPFKAVGARQREKLYSRETIHYTKSSPVISYSANPDIPSSKYRNRSEIFSFATPTAIAIMHSVIESEEKGYVESLMESEASSLKRRVWYDAPELFMKPRESDKSKLCNLNPSTVTELQPSSLSEVSVEKQPDHDVKVCETDSDPAIPDAAPSKWDSEFEDDIDESNAAESKSLTTSVVPDSSVPVHAESPLNASTDSMSLVQDTSREEDDVRAQTNGLPDDSVEADTPEQQSQSASMGIGTDLVNEYEEFMKSVCVNSEENSLGASFDKHPPTDSENVTDDLKKRKRRRVESPEKPKSAPKNLISIKKSSTTKKDKSKKRSRPSKKVSKDSTSSSPVSSDDEDEEEKPRIKRRKIKTKKSKLKTWKKSKKRKRQVSSSSSDEISSSSVSSDSVTSDSSLENSSSSEERISKKKRSKKGAKKKKKTIKKSKQKKSKSSKKEKLPGKKHKACADELVPAKNEKNLTLSKNSINEHTVEDKSSGKVYSSGECGWVDLKVTDKNQALETDPTISLDPVMQGKSISKQESESDDSEEFSNSVKRRPVPCESAPLATGKDRHYSTALLEHSTLLDSNINSKNNSVIDEMRTSSDVVEEKLPVNSKTDQKLLKGNEKYEIDSVEEGDSSQTAFVNDVSQARESQYDCVNDTKSNFSRLDVITAEAWENDSQEKSDSESKKLKYGGEWEEPSVNWFIKSTQEEQVTLPVDLMPTTRVDIQNTSSLSDDLHQEVGKRSLRELKYLRDVIKNEVVDEGALLESPPRKPLHEADSSNFIEKVSLAKTTMVTSFVKDFSERTDFLPVAPPTIENLPLASDLYSPGQEDDKSTRSNSPELVDDSYKITTEESKSDMSLDSPDPSDDSDKYAESNFLKIQKRHSESLDSQYISLGSIPLPSSCDLEAIEVPEEPVPFLSSSCDLEAIEMPEDPAPCVPNLVESAPVAGLGKSRAKECHESSSLAKTKHVITVKLLPSELRFKNVEIKPVEVKSAGVNEDVAKNDGKAGWKAIGGPNETAVPMKATVKRPSRWSSVPCEAIASNNFSPAEEILSTKLSPHDNNEEIEAEVSKDVTESISISSLGIPAIGSVAGELKVTNGIIAAVDEVSSSVIGPGLDTTVIVTKEPVLTHSSGDISLHENAVPPEADESKQVRAKELSECSDKEKDLSKKTDTRDKDNSRTQGSRGRDDSKRRDTREKDTKRKEERAKDDSRRGDRSDSRSRDRHKSDSRRDRRDVKRSRDERRKSPERSDSRHAEKHRTHGRDDEPRSPGARRSTERSDRRRRSRSRENSRSHRRSSRKRSPNHDRVRSSENKDDSRSSSNKSGKDGDRRRSERSGYNANGESLVNIPLPELQHHGRDDCCSMDMECCSPVSNFSPLVGLKRSVADSTTISDEELKLANSEQKSEDYSKQCYPYESPMPSSELRSSATSNAPAAESEFSPKRLSLDERLELELGLRMSPRQQQEQVGPPEGAQYPCYWPNQSAAPDAMIRPSLHTTPVGPQTNQFVGGPSNYYTQPQQQRLHNFMGAMNSPLMPTNPENNYPPNVRWDHVQTYPGMGTHSDRPPVQPLQVIVPEKQFIGSMPIETYINGPPLPTELVNRSLPGARPLSPRVLPASIPKVVLIPPMLAPMAVHTQAVQALVPPQDFIRQPNSIAESEMHLVHKFYPEESIYADIPSDTESEQKIIEILSKTKKKSLGRKAAHKQKEILRNREILKARELKKKKLAKYKKAILHEGDTLRRSVPLDLEEMRLNTGMQLSPRPGTSSSILAAFSHVGSFAPLPPASKGILISIGFGVGNEVALKERRKSVMFADGVRPGEGTSPSAGEDPLSPTLYVPKEKKLRKKKKKIKVHVIRQLASEESGSDSEAVPPPPPPPGSPLPELKPYSFPGPSPGKMILRLSKRIALGGSRVPRVVLVGPTELAPASTPACIQPESFERTCSDEKTLKLIAYHQAMIAIKGQVPFWSASVPGQTIGTVLESKPQLPHSTNVVMKAITTGSVDLFDQGNGNCVPCTSYPPSTNLTAKTSSSIPSAPGNPFLDTVGTCAAPPHGIFGEPKVTPPGERVSTVSPVLPLAFGFSSPHGLQPPLPHSPQLRNPPPPPPPLPVSKTIATAANPKV